MTAHPIPADADLVTLVLLNKQWDIEDKCAARKARRLTKYSARSLKAAATLRSRQRAADPLGGHFTQERGR
jgi:hypothetical protein